MGLRGSVFGVRFGLLRTDIVSGLGLLGLSDTESLGLG